ncbi:MAG: 3-keto-5-aminohexanoate cleavage enzyme [Thermosediminibacterales bacterium]|nr:3-keto-5-aminohexanoate cleavage enzyme [Thermosediminibacterales bacterium]MDK2835676.1 3-keto-5-aminohexanoate cleavage enzyme [Thermosediminibacterales bacterium]
MEKLIITVAPTGNVPTKELNPNVPITPDEIAECVYKCWQLGAAVAHIHARDGAGKPTSDPEVFKQIVEKIKAKCDIIIQLSTGARAGKTAEERGACIDLKPEMASLATGSSNFPTSVNSNSPALVEYLAQKMLDNNTKPEIEVFDSAMITNADYLAKKGLIKTPMQFNLVMNVPGSIKGSPKNLMHLIESLPEGSTYTVSGIGKSHAQMTAMGLVLGGHVRVGLEDVLELEKGKPTSNEELVKRVVDLAKVYGREIATPDEARKILNLK